MLVFTRSSDVVSHVFVTGFLAEFVANSSVILEVSAPSVDGGPIYNVEKFVFVPTCKLYGRCRYYLFTKRHIWCDSN